MPARAIGLAVRYSELLVAEQLGNKTFGTARHITTTLKCVHGVLHAYTHNAWCVQVQASGCHHHARKTWMTYLKKMNRLTWP